jgi:hypothetical protein
LLTPAFYALTSARQNPSAARLAIGAHARRPAAAEGAGKRRRKRLWCGIPVAGAQPPRRRDGGRRRGGIKAGGGGGESGRGVALKRCAASGTEMRVGEGGRWRGRARQQREMALRGAAKRTARRVEEEGRVRDGRNKERGGDEDGGREAKRRFWGKRLSADLEGDGAYIEPRPFVTGRIHNSDKRPFSLESCYDPRLKAPLLSRVASRPVTKGAFRAGCPEGEFSSFSPGWCYHRDKRGAFSLRW